MSCINREELLGELYKHGLQNSEISEIVNGMEDAGWHPIEEGLPPIDICLIVTIRDTYHQRLELRYPVEYRQSVYGDGYGFYQMLDGSLLTPERSEVTAWMPLPSPYIGGVE
ncbi:MAG: hypothetical protein LUC16_04040 [Coprobacillus sp.]|nr:hypothetical protein [Coprobacillus sp.]